MVSVLVSWVSVENCWCMWSGTGKIGMRWPALGPLPSHCPGPDTGAGSGRDTERDSVSLSRQLIIYYNFRTGSKWCFEVDYSNRRNWCSWPRWFDRSTTIIPLLCSKQREEEKACIPLPPTSYYPDYITLGRSANSYTLNTRDMDRITSDHTALYPSVVTGK